MWPLLGSLALVGLGVWLTVGLWRLHGLLRQAERDADAQQWRAVRYGQSMTWGSSRPPHERDMRDSG